VVDFIAANDIVSLEDLETLFEEAEADPSSVVIPDSVRDVLEDFAASGELSDEDTQNLEDFLNN